MARESARERAALMGSTAPPLARRLPFLVPDEAGREVSALAAAGGRLGDAVSLSVRDGRSSMPPTRRVSRADVPRLVPGVRAGRGGVVFWDGQLTDDARLVVALARTAAAYGARVLLGASVTAVDGADVHAELDNGEALTLRAGVVVNAAGVWAQRLAPGIRLVPSRGSHLVLRGSRLGGPSAALTVPLPGSRSRYVFALPQPDGLVYVGITDEPVSGPVPADDPQPSDAEVQQLLDTVNRVLADPIDRTDLVGSYAGLRPLVLPESAGTGPGNATADLSRKHLLRRDGSVLSVVGGKLTTYRAMAEEAVDAVVRRPGCTAVGDRAAAAPRGGSARRSLPGGGPMAAGRAVRHRGAARGGAGARRRRRRPAGDGGGAAVRRPPRGCAVGGGPAGPAHPDRTGACRPRACRSGGRAGAGRGLARLTFWEAGSVARDTGADCCRGDLHPRAWRRGPAGLPLAQRGELRRVPAARPPAGPRSARRRLRAGLDHRRPGRPCGSRPGARGRRGERPAGAGPRTRRTRGGAGGVPGGGRLRARGGRRLVRRRPRPPGSPAPDGPGRRASGDGEGVPARGRDRRAGRRLREHLVVSRGARPAPLADAVRPGHAAQRGRATRRAAAAVLGARGGAARRRAERRRVVLRHPGGPPVVGAVVGRPAHGVDVHRAGARARVRDPGRARGDRRCLAALGGGGRGLVRHAARRAAHPRVSGCVDTRFRAWNRASAHAVGVTPPVGRRWPGRRCSRTAPGRARSARSGR